MVTVYKKPFENMKKISLDMNEEILQIIDELAKLMKTSRTVIIGTLVGKGMSPFFKDLKDTWKSWVIKKETDEAKKKKIKVLLKELVNIERKYWDPKAN